MDHSGPFRHCKETETRPPSLSRNNRSVVQSPRQLLLDLSIQSNVIPSSLFLKRIFPSKDQAIGIGAHADVFYGTYEDQPVALKRLRVFFKTPDQSAIHKVRSYREANTHNTHSVVGFLPRSLIMASTPTSSYCTILRLGCRLFFIVLMYGISIHGGG
jgi:hypothetical protein